MKETKEYTQVTVNVLTDDGSLVPLKATSEKVNTFYNIKNLTTRCNMIDLLTVMSKVCKSSKDIVNFNHLLDLATADNTLEFTSVTELAKLMQLPRPTLSTLLSKLVAEEFLHKIASNKYLINPFIFLGKRVRSNEKREQLQKDWSQL
jgi:DNA-binding MarR family transcriptional regulator